MSTEIIYFSSLYIPLCSKTKSKVSQVKKKKKDKYQISIHRNVKVEEKANYRIRVVVLASYFVITNYHNFDGK